jgi:PAS domain S-box-containing protein
VILDVSEKTQTEKNPLAAENRFRALIETSADGIALFSRDETIQYLSPSASRILGYASGAPAGLSFSAFIHPDDLPLFQNTFADVRRTPFASWPIEFRYHHRDGSWRWMEAILTNLLEEPNVQAIVGDYRDVSDRKQAEQALQGRYQELQWLHEVSQAILVSRDLKAIVATILDKALSVSRCDLGIIRLLDRKTGLLETVASHGYQDPDNLLRHQRSTKNKTNNRVLPTFVRDEPIVIEALQKNPGLRTFKRENLQSLITVPVTANQEILGLLQVGSRSQRSFEPSLINLIKTLGSNLGIAVQKSRLLEDMVASQTELRGLARKLVEAQETERRYIARELHDEIGQNLTGLKFFLNLAMPPDTKTTNVKLERALALVDELMARVRDLSLRFRPAMLDDLGLLPTLQWYFQTFTDQTRIRFDFQHSGLDRRFTPEFETAAYRIVQESLTNVARHADVHEIKVRCRVKDESVSIEIEDHGTGFDLNSTMPITAGLSGMRERAASLGGRFTVQSAPGAGTRISAEFPLSSVERGVRASK